MGKEWTLGENDAQGEWALPDGWHGVGGRHFERRAAQQHGVEKSHSQSTKRFLGFAPLRSAPLGMTGWMTGKE
jgi:hypothetical protein